MDKDTILGVLAKCSPPLSPSQMDEIAEAVVSEWNKAVKQLKAELKPSKSSRSRPKRLLEVSQAELAETKRENEE